MGNFATAFTDAAVGKGKTRKAAVIFFYRREEIEEIIVSFTLEKGDEGIIKAEAGAVLDAVRELEGKDVAEALLLTDNIIAARLLNGLDATVRGRKVISGSINKILNELKKSNLKIKIGWLRRKYNLADVFTR